MKFQNASSNIDLGMALPTGDYFAHAKLCNDVDDNIIELKLNIKIVSDAKSIF